MEDFSDCIFYYEEEKERQLRLNRGLSFDIITEYMRNGKVVEVRDDPSPHYPHKKVALIVIDGYMTAVPYVREGDAVFLKTAFRSRKAHKRH